MNILITGGAGYIGTELVYRLVSDASVNQVVIYDNLNRNNHNIFLGELKIKAAKIRFVKGDILDTRKLKKEVDIADTVFHLAAKVTTPFADHNPHEFDQVNNWGTAELTYLIEQSNVSKFIYSSSLSVYGASQKPIDTNAQLTPRTFYGISKMNSEEHINRLHNSHIQVYTLRLGNVYGYSKSMRFDSVINKFIFEAHFADRIQIFGDGNQIRSFIHIDRLSEILTKIALTEVKQGIYNVVENTFSINEIVSELKLLYPTLEMVYVNQNVKMRSLNVNLDARLLDATQTQKNTLKMDLKNLKESFIF